MKAAIDFVQSSWMQQYSDLEAVLVSYTPSGSEPGTATVSGTDLDAAAGAGGSSDSGDSGGYLERTGGSVALVLSAGAAIAGAGLLLRRRK